MQRLPPLRKNVTHRSKMTALLGCAEQFSEGKSSTNDLIGMFGRESKRELELVPAAAVSHFPNLAEWAS